MLERHEGDSLPEDERDRPEPQVEATETDTTTGVSNRDYQAGFTAAMMLKDLRLAQDASKTARTPTPLGAQAAQLYALMEAAGEDGLDFSGVIKLIRGEI